jgi:hypothetical protein
MLKTDNRYFEVGQICTGYFGITRYKLQPSVGVSVALGVVEGH